MIYIIYYFIIKNIFYIKFKYFLLFLEQVITYKYFLNK
jgi:hypothetical protein